MLLVPAHSLPLPFLILSSLLSLPCASANTEIRNVHAFASGSSLPPAAAAAVAAVSEVAAAWPVLHASTPAHTRAFAVVPAPLGTPLRDVCEPVSMRARGCEHELWVRLDLDDASWTRFERFTLRVSWPAFYPTDFDIALYTPAALVSHFHVLLNTTSTSTSASPDPDFEPELKDIPTTRVQFARIRLVDTGVRPPLPSPPPSLSSLSNKSPHTHTDPVPVPFTLTLEPLLLGVLPSSLLPTLLVIVPALVTAALAIPPTLRALEGVVGQARKELGYAGLKRD